MFSNQLHIVSGGILLLFLLSVTGMAQNKTEDLDSLVFATHWLPQAQFAGYYMAKEKGFYGDAGLKVDIIHPPANLNALQYLEDGSADIVSLFLVTALEARVQGGDLANIAQMSEHSAIVFVCKKDNTIREIKDFENRKIGVWKSGFEEVPRSFLKDRNIFVEWVPILSSVNLFLMDGIDLMTVMWYNEFNQIYLSGMNEDELTTFFLSDYGYDIPEDGLYASSSTIALKEDALSRFVEASLRGWEYAASHFDEAIDLVLKTMKASNIPASEAHQRWMLEKILELQGFGEGQHVKEVKLSMPNFEKSMRIADPDSSLNKEQLLKMYEQFVRPLAGK